MSNDGVVRLQLEGRLARITIDRPDKRNALSLDMWRSIPPLIAEINANPRIRGVIVQGEGDDAFAAGADIFELELCIDAPEKALVYMQAVEAAEGTLGRCKVPVIAMIRGFCIGAGMEVAMACDRRIATPDSLFAIPPAKLGVTYSLSSTHRVMALVGIAAAKDIMFTARECQADEALKLGLIDEIVAREDIAAHVEKYLDRLARNSPFSISATKTIMNAIWHGAVTESEEIRNLRLSGYNEPDLKEGIRSFRERRRPDYNR
jgi:enoyl-CoA hydratase